MRLDLIPRITSLWVSLKVGQTCLKLGFKCRRDFDGVWDRSNALPNRLNKLNALLHGKFQNSGNRNLTHERQFITDTVLRFSVEVQPQMEMCLARWSLSIGAQG